jgi:VIT1/CCC1 family predicted Fe2+/Mn2+ transporter
MTEHEKQMDEAEARSILEDLARNGPATAQVAAIKVLLALGKEEAEAKAEESTGFDRLDELYRLADDRNGQRKERPK